MQKITAAVIRIMYKSNICDLTLDYAKHIFLCIQT
jgi:hypothetical protein